MRRVVASLAVALVLSACVEPRRAREVPVQAAVSRADVFLQAVDGGSVGVAFEVAGLSLRREDGELVELELLVPSVSSREFTRRTALAGGPVRAGAYVAVVLEVSGATIDPDGRPRAARLLPVEPGGDEEILVQPPEEGPGPTVAYEIPVRLKIGLRDATSVFLEWDVAGSVVLDEGFRPVFGASREMPRARLGTIYATDAATGSILVLDRSTGAIVGTGKVGKGPSALAVSSDRSRVFVSNAADGSLSVMETLDNRVTSTIPIRLGAGTSDVVLATPLRLVAATNTALDTVSFFNILESSRIADIRVGRAPVRLAAALRQRRVFVVNSQSNDLSVIDSNSLGVIATIPLESEPTDIAIDTRERRIVVCHRTSPDLLVLDVATLAVLDSIVVGLDATAVLFDRRRNRVYVARSSPLEVAVVDLSLRAVVRRISIESTIVSLTQPLEGPSIYGAAPDLGAILVVNVVRGGTDPPVPCGARPTDAVIID